MPVGGTAMLVGAAGSAYSSNKQASAAKKAARIQARSTDRGIEFQREALNQQRADLQPFRRLGSPQTLNAFRQAATNQPDYSYKPDTDPLLNNALNRTARAVMDAQAAKGKLASGETQVALAESLAPIYMQRQDQQFQQAYNTQNQRYNQLSGIVGLAQNAAAMQGNATQSATNNITDLTTQGANALAAGKIGAANARTDMFNNILGAGAMYYGLRA